MKYVTLEHWINHNEYCIIELNTSSSKKIYEFKNDFILEVVTNSIPSETETHEFEMILPKKLHAIAL